MFTPVDFSTISRIGALLFFFMFLYLWSRLGIRETRQICASFKTVERVWRRQVVVWNGCRALSGFAGARPGDGLGQDVSTGGWSATSCAIYARWRSDDDDDDGDEMHARCDADMMKAIHQSEARDGRGAGGA